MPLTSAPTDLSLIGLTPIAWLMALAYVFVGPLVAPCSPLPLYTTRAAYKAVVDVRNMFTQTVRALASAIDARDPSTRRHSDHVSRIAVEIGQVMRLVESELEQLEWAGLLHDIGKIGIRDAVLLKPDRLTREERMLMNEHPVKGEEILKDVDQLARSGRSSAITTSGTTARATLIGSSARRSRCWRACCMSPTPSRP